MSACWLFGRFWCVCVSFEDIVVAYLGWFVVAFVHYVAHVQAISYIESDGWRLCCEIGLKLVTALIYISHACAMWCDPGFVAPDATGAWQAHLDAVQDTVGPPTTVGGPPAAADQRSMEDRLLMQATAAAADAHKGFCLKCRDVKPTDAHHCSKCGRCVHVMDHHCPWTNNCVGRRNIKFFLLFLLYTGMGSAYALALLLWRASTMRRNARQRSLGQPLMDFNSPAALVPPLLWTLACCMALGFCVFVTSMLIDQHQAIVSQVRFKPRRDASARERERREMRGEDALPEAPSRPLLSALTEACGEAPHPRWLLPVRAPAGRDDGSGGMLRAGRGLKTCTPAGFASDKKKL